MTATRAPAQHSKCYRSAAACRAAAANYQWLARAVGPVRLPRLISAGPCRLVFEHVTGRHAQPRDLVTLARHLGEVHLAAYASELWRAHLAVPYSSGSGHRIPAFTTRRVAAVRRLLRACLVPDPAFDHGQAVRLLNAAAQSPAAFYKDANPRNFLITPGGPVTIDFDDLTLAPFGYDLAKLIVTLAMTHGRLPPRLIGQALAAYNAAGIRCPDKAGNVTWTQLMAWAEIHHVLTSRYLGQAGYRRSWHTVRPSPADDVTWP